MVDYYNILGINKDASIDDIKKAYKKKALQCHPDKTGGDDTLFKQINEAHNTLSDPQKKHAYDNPHNGNGPDLFDIFRNMGMHTNTHTNNHIKKRDNINYNLKIKLKDVYTGLTKSLKINIIKNCLKCVIKCDKCNGEGISTNTIQMGPFIQRIQTTCDKCSGDKIIKHCNMSCTDCNGKYEIREDKIIKVDLPRCVENGFNIVVKECGIQIKHKDETPGDLIITVFIENDEYFTREKNNLILHKKITLAESITGKIINVPHFENTFDLNINIFGIINPNKRYHLKSHGLTKNDDLIFVFEIIYPDKIIDTSISEELHTIFKKIGI